MNDESKIDENDVEYYAPDLGNAIIIVTCSKCWNDVTLRDLNIEPNYPYSGECTHCMVTLDARIESEDNE